MKTFMSLLRKIFREIREYFIIAYAKNRYDKAVKLADELYKKNNKAYYVVIDPYTKKKIVVLSKDSFRRLKRKTTTEYVRVGVILDRLIQKQEMIKKSGHADKNVLGIIKQFREHRKDLDTSIDVAKNQNMTDLYNGCFYSTRLLKESSAADIEARRLVYIQWVLDVSRKK